MNATGVAAIAEMWRSAWIQGLLVFVLWVVVLLFVHGVLMRHLRRIAARTSWTWDDVLIRSLSAPSRLVIVGSGLVILGRLLPLDPEWHRPFDILLAGTIVLAIILFVDRATGDLLDRLSRSYPALSGARGLLRGSVRGLIIAIGLLIFLDSLGISIAPILASLGVGSLAVALALQDTLANFFAGLHLVADKPIEQGQFVRLQTGEEGEVVRLGWRTTWLRTPQNTTVVVPNSKLAGSVLTNFDLPGSDTVFNVEVTAALQTGLATIERVTADVAQAAQSSAEGATPGYQPQVRFTGFADSGIRVNILLSAATLKESHGVRHAFLKMLAERYRREGIVIPFPTRTIDLPPGAFPPGPPGPPPPRAGGEQQA